METISVAIIARNAGGALEECLKSIRPHVDEIVVVLGGESTDDTEEIARKYADIVQPFVWVNDFSAARQYSFSLCTKDWILWLDSDDILRGGERLRKIVKECPEPVVGYWLAYEYGHDDLGNCTTVFDRERLVKRKVGWQWLYRIHEVLKCQQDGAKWLREDKIAVIHKGHDAASSIQRNINYLMTDEYARNPNDPRTIEYLGNQFFALGQFGDAIHYWERWQNVQNENAPYRQWWVWLYMGHAYRELGDWDHANRCYFCALDCCPDYAETYYGLAEVYLNMGELERALHWIKEGRNQKNRPPSWLFLNPMDLTYRHHVIAEQIYFRMGQLDKAIGEVKARQKIRDTEEVRSNAKSFLEGKQRLAYADRYMKRTQKKTPAEVLAVPLPDYMRALPGIQLRHGSALHATKAKKERRIAFMCGRSIEDWYPRKIEDGGIGGSETAVIEIARRFAAAGWRVDVYNQPYRFYGDNEGVNYWPYPLWNPDEHADVFVAWRGPEYILNRVNAGKKILWLHDLNISERLTKDLADRFDVIAGVSEWHAEYLKKCYPFLKDVTYFPNGVNLERFTPPEGVQRESHRCVYLSSPDRGLDVLLQMWPRILKVQGGAELHIYYGWQGVDFAIAQGDTKMLNLKAHMSNWMNQPNVFWHGRVDQQTLVTELYKSSLWLYPAHFPETFCISAVEVMAAGVVPVTADIGALRTTIGEAGLLLPGESRNPLWIDKYLSLIWALMFDPTIREPYREKGIERAKLWTWDKSFENHWLPAVQAKKPVEVAA